VGCGCGWSWALDGCSGTTDCCFAWENEPGSSLLTYFHHGVHHGVQDWDSIWVVDSGWTTNGFVCLCIILFLFLLFLSCISRAYEEYFDDKCACCSFQGNWLG
jgi:hypothetical protein